MLDTLEILKACFSELKRTYEVVLADSIPGVSKIDYVQTWKVTTEAIYKEKLCIIELFLGFNVDFPYSLPDIYLPSAEFKYIPHRSFLTGKLCLAPDDCCYDIDDCSRLIKSCIGRSLSIVESDSKELESMYNDEIISYWNETDDGEPIVDCYGELHCSMPQEVCVLDAVEYKKEVVIDGEARVGSSVIIFNDENTVIKEYVDSLPVFRRADVCYVTSFTLPSSPPYKLTFSQFLDKVSDIGEKKFIRKYINHNRGGTIIFPLSESMFGGIVIKSVPFQRDGFRIGSLSSCQVLCAFENSYKNQQRIFGKVLSTKRISMRTSGQNPIDKKFVIAGLGSIGSNLTYFLSGWQGVQMVLIDDDILDVDNIGRHFLGYRDTASHKADALAKHFKGVNPTRKIHSVRKRLQEVLYNQLDTLNSSDALFVCTGSHMSEQCVIDYIMANKLKVPVFILWVEPYCVAGHMLYLNPDTLPRNLDLFSQTDMRLYKYNLIDDEEYEDPEKFIKRDAGCNSEYTNYSGNDVILYLSSIYPEINKLLMSHDKSKCFRWVGNIRIAEEKGIKLKSILPSGLVQTLEL